MYDEKVYDEKDWVLGNISLGAAANWAADEIRLVAELGFALAQNGRNHEAITIFEGLNTLAPATPYFEAALGSLWFAKTIPPVPLFTSMQRSQRIRTISCRTLTGAKRICGSNDMTKLAKTLKSF